MALLLIRLEGDQYLLFLRYLPLSQVGLKNDKLFVNSAVVAISWELCPHKCGYYVQSLLAGSVSRVR